MQKQLLFMNSLCSNKIDEFQFSLSVRLFRVLIWSLGNGGIRVIMATFYNDNT